jgi:hypothetical protein
LRIKSSALSSTAPVARGSNLSDPSKKELDKLRAVIRGDLADASLDAALADRRFATAYNAALQAAKMAIACAGYRVVGAGYHRISFDVVKLGLAKLRTRLVITSADARESGT